MKKQMTKATIENIIGITAWEYYDERFCETLEEAEAHITHFKSLNSKGQEDALSAAKMLACEDWEIEATAVKKCWVNRS